MILKNFYQFINENKISLGERIESVYNDDYIKNIVNRYIKDIDPSISISNAVNVLDDDTKREIKYQVDNYLENGLEEKDPIVSTSVEIDELLEESMAQEEISLSGKSVFKSFLKSVTALGGKDNKANYDICPNDFLIYYQISNISTDDIRSVFSRFKSLNRYIGILDNYQNNCNLYFGIKLDGYFEYGLSYEGVSQMGKFKLNKSAVNWILKLQSKSAQSLKIDLHNLKFQDIVLLGTIKQEMDLYNPGYFEEKSSPIINNKIISFSYYGIGNWNNGVLSNEDFFKIKSNFNDWLLNKKWSSKVLFSMDAQSFWLNIHLKIKN